MLLLNRQAQVLCEQMQAAAETLGVCIHQLPGGTQLFDCGIDAPGSQAAGTLLARICLASLGEVQVVENDQETAPWPAVYVTTEHPLAACLASQYAGWEVKGKNFFAMGSGPMRANAAREPLFQEPLLAEIAQLEKGEPAVGVLESSQLPTDEICQALAEKCQIQPSQLTLLVAPTSSIVGTLQVVARSVETALHKMHELKFDLSRVVRGQGVAPLPPVAHNDLAAIGVTNDAILYGGRVRLQVRGDDRSLESLGPQIPSSASADFGRPFAEILAHVKNDFYQIDPLLFSPAEITLENLDTGNSFTYGDIHPEVLSESLSISA